MNFRYSDLRFSHFDRRATKWPEVEKSIKKDFSTPLRCARNDTNKRINYAQLVSVIVSMRFSAVLAGNQLSELIAVLVEPFGFSADHQEEIGAVEVAEEAGSGDWQYRLGDHRLDH